MEENENLAYIKKEQISLIHRLIRGRRNIKINLVKFIYIIFIILFILLFTIIIVLFIENKRLYKEIIERQNKIKSIPINAINNGEKVTIAKKLFQYQEEDEIYNNRTQIHVSYSLDNQLIYPTLVSMVSGLENFNDNNNSSLLVYHLLLSHDFNTSKVEIFETLKKNYTVKINYYVIPHIFSYSRTWTDGTDYVYYKIILPIMFPDLKRIIYIDGDTLIRKDISEMYNAPFNDNYILGFPFYMAYVMDSYGINVTNYINGGCLLFNIEKIRKDQKDVDLLQFTLKNNSVLRFREQDSINYIFYPNVGLLPLKFGIYMIGSKGVLRSLMKSSRSKVNMTEAYEALEDPGLVHFSCCWPKVWTKGSKNLFRDDDICLKYQKEFYYYAKKTQYYSEIYNSLYNPK